MNTLPSTSLVISDLKGHPFALIRLAPAPHRPSDKPGVVRGECIFDVSPTSDAQAARQEVRWLFKRRYVRAGEHTFKLDAKGVLRISQGDFGLQIDTNEEPLHISLPMPPLGVAWGEASAAQ